MRCPFLKEVTARSCSLAPLAKPLPSEAISVTDERCSSPAYRDCPLTRDRLVESDFTGACPFLRETAAQQCSVSEDTRLLPTNETLFSRCRTDAHRHCAYYLQHAADARHPATRRARRARRRCRGPHGADGVIPAPSHLLYTRNHLWVDCGEDGSCDVGVDAFLTRVVGDVEEVCFHTPSGDARPSVVILTKGVGLSLTFPKPLRITNANALLRTAPDLLTMDPYGAGWLYEGTELGPAAESHGSSLENAWVLGEEVGSWMRDEMGRLSEFVAEVEGRRGHGAPAILSDGGALAPGLASHLERDALYELFERFFPPLGVL